jgi:transcriptional regulator with XRE-family HTH domain
MKELKELSARVRHQRVAQGLKQQELAAKAAVSTDALSALENGRSVTVESLLRVLRALGYGEALVNVRSLCRNWRARSANACGEILVSMTTLHPPFPRLRDHPSS